MSTKKPECYRNIGEVLDVLKCLNNEKRLLIVCRIISVGEQNVGELVDFIGLSPSALSQHLAVLREAKIVKTRKTQQTVYYSIADSKVKQLVDTLHKLYC